MVRKTNEALIKEISENRIFILQRRDSSEKEIKFIWMKNDYTILFDTNYDIIIVYGTWSNAKLLVQKEKEDLEERRQTIRSKQQAVKITKK